MYYINLKNIPEELKALPNWINWRLGEWVSTGDYGVGFYRKVSMHPNGETWDGNRHDQTYSFETVIKAYENSYTKATLSTPQMGIAFVLKNGEPYICLDLDDNETLPPLSDLAQRLLIHQLDSYTERSPSNKGYHVIVKVNHAVQNCYAESSLHSSLLTGGHHMGSRYSWVTMTGEESPIFPLKPIREIDFNASVLKVYCDFIDLIQAAEEEY